VCATGLSIYTGEGDTTFFAPLGDTVEVKVGIDSGDEDLSGIEVFLAYDPRVFRPVDALPAEGDQPALPGDLLGTVLSDTLLALPDSLYLVHYAEASLAARKVSGVLCTLQLCVRGWHSGVTEIGVYESENPRLTSAYTVPNVEGQVSELGAVRPLRYADRPPVWIGPGTVEVEEDGVLSVHTSSLAADEMPPDALIWSVTEADSLAEVSVRSGEGGPRVWVTPYPDRNGAGTVTFTVADPAGGWVEGALPFKVEPVNDAPVIVPGVLPDSVDMASATYTLDLSGLATDVDDAAHTLVWTAEGAGSVVADIEVDAEASISVPWNWQGEGAVRLAVTDPGGARDSTTLRVVRTVAPEALPGDFTQDGRVDFEDFLSFAGAYGRTDAPAAYDLDGSGRVDFPDFLVLVENYGRALD